MEYVSGVTAMAGSWCTETISPTPNDSPGASAASAVSHCCRTSSQVWVLSGPLFRSATSSAEVSTSLTRHSPSFV